MCGFPSLYKGLNAMDFLIEKGGHNLTDTVLIMPNAPVANKALMPVQTNVRAGHPKGRVATDETWRLACALGPPVAAAHSS
jgi:hypothetical protein